MAVHNGEVTVVGSDQPVLRFSKHFLCIPATPRVSAPQDVSKGCRMRRVCLSGHGTHRLPPMLSLVWLSATRVFIMLLVGAVACGDVWCLKRGEPQHRRGGETTSSALGSCLHLADLQSLQWARRRILSLKLRSSLWSLRCAQSIHSLWCP